MITHNSDDTGYKILLQDKGHSVPVKTVDNVIVRKLAATLVELIDDGTKRVEILRRAWLRMLSSQGTTCSVLERST